MKEYGPGKYDTLCTAAREGAKAAGALLIIINGEKGSGFSVQIPPELILTIPDILRHVANGIEGDHQ